jgi:hypothetical protein
MGQKMHRLVILAFVNHMFRVVVTIDYNTSLFRIGIKRYIYLLLI